MKISSLGVAAALLPLLALPVLAQDASSAVSAASGEVGLSLSTEASAATGPASFDSLVAALLAEQAATDLSAITEASQVNFVTVSSLQTADTAAALDQALTEHQAAVDQLRTDVGANAALTAKLSAASYTADQVLAVVTETDGSVTVYIDDRA